MNHFNYVDNKLWCEEVPLCDVARAVGTPFYLYSYRTLTRHFRVFDTAFADVSHILCFSVKSNSNIAILKIFVNEGGGMDVVSGGELYRALKAGADPKKIVYSGVGKKVEEIESALEAEILMFNVESSQELEFINECAGRIGKKAGVALRINPDIDPMTHPHIATGLKESKFGINVERSFDEYRRAKELKHINIIGVDCHIGSQVTEILPFMEAVDRLKKLIYLLRKESIDIKYLDLGGGLGIKYENETPPEPEEYARAVIDASKDIGCTLILEPGRVIVGNTGILVSKVLYTKSSDDKNFIIIDAGMNDLIRPSLYGSYHHIQPVVLSESETFLADVVGPICESGDFLAKNRILPRFNRGELIAVMSAGAYGFTMASNYNSRPRIPEVLVKDDRYYVIREREEYSDLIRGENIPDFLKK